MLFVLLKLNFLNCDIYIYIYIIPKSLRKPIKGVRKQFKISLFVRKRFSKANWTDVAWISFWKIGLIYFFLLCVLLTPLMVGHITACPWCVYENTFSHQMSDHKQFYHHNLPSLDPALIVTEPSFSLMSQSSSLHFCMSGI